MRRITLLVLFALSSLLSSVYGQDLKQFADPRVEKDPGEYLAHIPQNYPATTIQAAGILYNVGHCLQYLNQEEKATQVLINAKKLFEISGFTTAANDLALEIHTIVSSQEHYKSVNNNFISEYFSFAQKTHSDERLALAYYEFGSDALDVWENDSIPKQYRLDSTRTIFETALRFAKKSKKPIPLSKAYKGLFVVALNNEDYTAARNYLDQSLFYAKKEGDAYDTFSHHYNTGLTYFYQENYSSAVTWLKLAETIPLPRYQLKTKRVLYKKLMQSYDALNDQPNRRHYQKQFMDLEAKINDEAQNIAIHEAQQKYNADEKDRQISNLELFKDKFYKNRLVFGILLFLVFLLALYSFVRWKKLDRHKRTLEKEKLQVQEEKQVIERIHHKTVEELEKVKSIVTEEHITLKDNTKVYLNDLMYIKAEDHYLHLFNADAKKHLVRGKISQIIEELPPNFVKCHRSYIVNTNFIATYGRGFVVLKNKEEVPTSRNFKF